MAGSPENENSKSYSSIKEPFGLLEIDITGKTISELYRELNFRAREEYKEHCYRSKKNYTSAQFRKTTFYRRYSFLRRHLRETTFWLYDGRTEMPKELKNIMAQRIDYSNPWGTGSGVATIQEIRLKRY